MKKIVTIVALVIVLAVLATVLAGCGNKQLLDLTYTFNYAIIKLPDGNIVKGDVESWKDFDDGDQIQVKIKGVTYLVHSSNVVLEAK